MSHLSKLFVSSIFVVRLCCEAIAADEHAIYHSLDGGQSWTRFDEGIPKGSRTNAFGQSGNTLFAGTDSGLYLRVDASQPWRVVESFSTVRITCISASRQLIILGTDGNGLHTSRDAGKTWTRSTSLQIGKVRSLLIDDGMLYVGADAEGIFVSKDCGDTWTQLATGLPSQAQVFDIAKVGNALFTGLYSKGLYKWTEAARQWTRVGGVSPLVLISTGDTLVAGHNPGGIYWSDDFGKSWTKGTARGTGDVFHSQLQHEAPVWAAGADDQRAIVGASDGIFISDDRGRTWTRASGGLPARCPGIAFLVTPRHILSATTLTD